MKSKTNRWPANVLRPLQRPRGFTLIELMITLSVAAILLALAVPNLNDALLNGKLSSQANAFLSSLLMARSEAIKRNTRVVVCKSADGSACAGSGGWDQGWIVFQDANNNAAVDTGEAIIQRNESLATGFSLAGGAPVKDYVSFHPSGATMLTTGGFQAGTLTLCRFLPTVASQGREIVISSTGRARIAKKNDVSSCPPP